MSFISFIAKKVVKDKIVTKQDPDKTFNAEEDFRFTPPSSLSFKLFHVPKTVPRSQREVMIDQLELYNEFGVEISLEPWIASLIPKENETVPSYKSIEEALKKNSKEEGTFKLKQKYNEWPIKNALKRLDLNNKLNHDLILSHWTHSIVHYRYFALVMLEDLNWMEKFGDKLSEIINKYMIENISTNTKNSHEMFMKVYISLHAACSLQSQIGMKFLQPQVIYHMCISDFDNQSTNSIKKMCIELIRKRRSNLLSEYSTQTAGYLIEKLNSTDLVFQDMEGDIISYINLLLSYNLLPYDMLKSIVSFLKNREVSEENQRAVQYLFKHYELENNIQINDNYKITV